MTAQLHENLTIDGEETSMAFCPPLPGSHPRIVKSSDPQASKAKPALKGKRDPMLESTACWRGYQGTWEIRDGRFYLVELRGRFRLCGGEPLLADWFSGVLRVPRGRVLEPVHMGFGSVHERETHIKVERGVVVATRDIDNRGRKHDKWALAEQNLPGSENRFPGDDEM